MADIIVTTPKSESANAAREAEHARQAGGDTRYFRAFPLGRAPRVNKGDRIFYVDKDYVWGFAVVDEVTDHSEGLQCDTTGAVYRPGSYVFMRADSWTWILPVEMGGFRGYRYAANFGLGRGSVEIVGGWLDPRPTREDAA